MTNETSYSWDGASTSTISSSEYGRINFDSTVDEVETLENGDLVITKGENSLTLTGYYDEDTKEIKNDSAELNLNYPTDSVNRLTLDLNNNTITNSYGDTPDSLSIADLDKLVQYVKGYGINTVYKFYINGEKARLGSNKTEEFLFDTDGNDNITLTELPEDKHSAQYNLTTGNDTLNIAGEYGNHYSDVKINLGSGEKTINIDNHVSASIGVSGVNNTSKTHINIDRIDDYTMNGTSLAVQGYNEGVGNRNLSISMNNLQSSKLDINGKVVDYVNDDSASRDDSESENGKIYSATQAKDTTISSGVGDDVILAWGTKENTIVDKGGNNIIKVNSGVGNITVGSDEEDPTIYVNKITTGKAKDEITLKNDTNIVYTGSGKDTINIKGGINTVNAGKDNDTINIEGGTNTIVIAYTLSGEAGNDTINGASANDTLKFVEGDYGSNFTDLTFAKSGDDLKITTTDGSITTVKDFFTSESKIDSIVTKDQTAPHSLLSDATINVTVNDGETYTVTGYNENITINGEVTIIINNNTETDTSVHNITLGADGKVHLKYLKGDTLYSFEQGKATLNNDGSLTLIPSLPKSTNKWAKVVITDYLANGQDDVTFTNDSTTTPYTNVKLEDNMLPIKVQTAKGIDDALFTLGGTTHTSSSLPIPFEGTFLSDAIAPSNDNNNNISTGDSDDYIKTKAGNDTLNAGAGDDYIESGAGDDTINPGAGNDTISGGSGNDTFIFATEAGTNTITDASADDTIQFTDVTDFSKLTFGRMGGDILTITVPAGPQGSLVVKLPTFFSDESKVDSILINDGNPAHSILTDATIEVDLSANSEEGVYTATNYKESYSIGSMGGTEYTVVGADNNDKIVVTKPDATPTYELQPNGDLKVLYSITSAAGPGQPSVTTEYSMTFEGYLATPDEDKIDTLDVKTPSGPGSWATTTYDISDELVTSGYRVIEDGGSLDGSAFSAKAIILGSATLSNMDSLDAIEINTNEVRYAQDGADLLINYGTDKTVRVVGYLNAETGLPAVEDNVKLWLNNDSAKELDVRQFSNVNQNIEVEGNEDKEIVLPENPETTNTVDMSTATGDNKVIAGDSTNTITTGAGTDTVVAGDGGNTVNMGAGADNINLGDGDNTVQMAGATTGAADKTIELGAGQNTVTANVGDTNKATINITGTSYEQGVSEETRQTVNVTGGTENAITVQNGAANVTLNGGTDANVQTAEGNDNINLLNGATTATVNAGEGDDTITVAKGVSATVTGGEGSDHFVLLKDAMTRSPITPTALITDATSADTIDFEDATWNNLTFSRNGADLQIAYGNNLATVQDFFTMASPVNIIRTNDDLDDGTTPLVEHNIKNEAVINVTLEDGDIYDASAIAYKQNITVVDDGTAYVSGMKRGNTNYDNINIAYTGLSREGNSDTLTVTDGTHTIEITDFFDRAVDLYLNGTKTSTATQISVTLAGEDYESTKYRETISGYGTVSELTSNDSLVYEASAGNQLSFTRNYDGETTTNNDALVIAGNNAGALTITDYFDGNGCQTLNGASIKENYFTINLTNNAVYEADSTCKEIITGTGSVSGLGSSDKLANANATLTRNYDGTNNDKLTIVGDDGTLVVTDFFTDNQCNTLNDETITDISVVLSNDADYTGTTYNETISGAGTVHGLTADDRIAVGTATRTYDGTHNDELAIGDLTVTDFFTTNRCYTYVGGNSINAFTVTATQNYTALNGYYETIIAGADITVTGMDKTNDSLIIGGEKTFHRTAGNNNLLISGTHDVTVTDFFASEGDITVDTGSTEGMTLQVSVPNGINYVATGYDEVLTLTEGAAASVSGLESTDKLLMGGTVTYARTNSSNTLIVSNGTQTLNVTDFAFDGSHDFMVGEASTAEQTINVTTNANYTASGYNEIIYANGNIVVSNLDENGKLLFSNATTYTQTATGCTISDGANSVTLAGKTAANVPAAYVGTFAENSADTLSNKQLVVTGFANYDASVQATRFGSVNITGASEAEGTGTLTGTANADVITGGAGVDTITGGGGNDALVGGEGDDIFVFTEGSGADAITDAERGDVLQITGAEGKSVTDLTFTKNTTTGKLTIAGFGGVSDSITVNYDYENPNSNIDDFTFNGEAYKISNNIIFDIYLEGGTFNKATSVYKDYGVNIIGYGTVTGLAETDKVTIEYTSLNRAWDGTHGNVLTITGATEGYDLVIADFFSGHACGKINDDVIKNNLPINVKLSTNTLYTAEADYNEVITGSGSVSGLTANDTVTFANTIQDILACTGDALAISDGTTTITVTDYFTSENARTASIYPVDLKEKALTITGRTTYDNTAAYGGFASVNITGTAGVDTYVGGDGNDVFEAKAGNDTLTGGNGNDTFIFNAGDGVDTIKDAKSGDIIKINGYTNFTGITFRQSTEVGHTDELIISYNGADTIKVEGYFTDTNTPANNHINTFMLGDTTYTLEWKQSNVDGSYAMYNVIDGTDAGDNIQAVNGILNWVNGGNGNDSIVGGDKYDMLAGNAGNDTITSTVAAQIFGGEDNDTINAASGSFIDGGLGNDTINVTGGSNTILFVNTGVAEGDFKKTGNDILNGATSTDRIVFALGAPGHKQGYSIAELSFAQGEGEHANSLMVTAGGYTLEITNYFTAENVP